MHDREIKISVIVPVYNAGKYLKVALDSVFKQSFTDWELILVDNMSKDNSLTICESYAQTDDRVCIYKEEKNGAGAARNTGMKMARGEYLCFLDADDCLAGTDILQKLAEQMERQQADIVVCNYERNWNGRLLPAAGHEAFSSLDREEEDFRFKGFFSVGTLSYVWGRLYRKAFLDEHGICFQNLAYAEDKLFNLQCYLYQAKFGFMDDIGYIYRKNDDSISYQYKPESAKCWLQIAHTVQEQITAGGSVYRDYEGLVRYTLFFAAFFDAKMEYVEHGKSMKAVRKTLRTYEGDALGHKCFQKLAFGKEVRRISQGLWKVMMRGFSLGMHCHMFGLLALGIKFLIDLRIDERLSDTGLREE